MTETKTEKETMFLWEIRILWKQRNGRMEGQTIRKKAAKDGGRFNHLRSYDLKA